jgi:N-acetylglucosaminyl-diphospho-decaprenol L-rhamnosyltransferase
MHAVDVVVVSFNSEETLRACVEPLVGLAEVNVILVDSASRDGSVESVSDLPLRIERLPENYGFAYACNRGWKLGNAPSVLFLNPDATIDPPSLERLAGVARDPWVGAVAPKILEAAGSLDFSMRRFPRLRTTYAQALFLHRLFPHAEWSDELVRDPNAYAGVSSPEWVSGACVLLKRDLLERLDGFDEGFFLYCEDIDLCRRVRDAGFEIRFEPGAVATHSGGASAPRAQLLPVLAASRIRYARKHRSRLAALLERAGVALGAVTHAVVARGGRAARRGHARAVVQALRPGRSNL